jgi:hypothetical protein
VPTLLARHDYLIDEIQGTYRGMMISIPAVHWQAFETLDLPAMGLMLHRHVSTARLLETHQTLLKSGVPK